MASGPLFFAFIMSVSNAQGRLQILSENMLKELEFRKRLLFFFIFPPNPVNQIHRLESEQSLCPIPSSIALWAIGFLNRSQADEKELLGGGQDCFGDSPGSA